MLIRRDNRDFAPTSRAVFVFLAVHAEKVSDLPVDLVTYPVPQHINRRFCHRVDRTRCSDAFSSAESFVTFLNG